MKKLLLLCLTTACSHVVAVAQSSKDNSPSTRGNSTTIEIRDGEVFLNGEKVKPDENSNGNSFFQKKIIINGKDVTDQFSDEKITMPWSDMDGAVSQKPMLGVNTKASKNNDGAEIESIVPGSPADKYGLKAGDVITRVGTKNIYSPQDLVEAIGSYKAGDKVDVTFERGADFLTKNVELSHRNDGFTMRSTIPLDPQEFFKDFDKLFPFSGEREIPFRALNSANNNSVKIGVSVEDRADGDGVYVYEVETNSAADKAGIKQGDVLLRFGTKAIGNVDELMEAIKSQQGAEKVKAELSRNGQKKSVEVTIPKQLKKRQL